MVVLDYSDPAYNSSTNKEKLFLDTSQLHVCSFSWFFLLPLSLSSFLSLLSLLSFLLYALCRWFPPYRIVVWLPLALFLPLLPSFCLFLLASHARIRPSCISMVHALSQLCCCRFCHHVDCVADEKKVVAVAKRLDSVLVSSERRDKSMST